MGTYLPGFKAGGPIRSIENLVSALGSEFQFRIVTEDRDLGDRRAYPGIATDRWTPAGPAAVLYVRPGLRGLVSIARVLAGLGPETVLYLNSYFARRFSMFAMLLVRLGVCRPAAVLLAPRGEFSSGALRLKSLRKRLYIHLASRLGIYAGILWHASTEFEKADILGAMSSLSSITIAKVLAIHQLAGGETNGDVIRTAKDIHRLPAPVAARVTHKRAGELRVVFLSRISPKKNLLGAIRMLMGVRGQIWFDIYGPIEDERYWRECAEAINQLPKNIMVNYRGLARPERVAGIFAANDLFLFPTLGENYGHAICEALTAGCPVLISDQTPWRGLEQQGVGWDLALDDEEQFRSVLERCADACEEWYAALASRAAVFGRAAASDPSIIEENRVMFRDAVRHHRQTAAPLAAGKQSIAAR
jgi:glycosyltransferase involved in cell wall biosynthesis